MLHLHCHSVYSYKLALSDVDAIAKYAKENGQKSFCVTDIDSMTSFIKGASVAESMGLKFIQGMDVSVEPDESVSYTLIQNRIQTINKEMGLKRTTEEMAIEYEKEREELLSVDSVECFRVVLLAANFDGLIHMIHIYNQMKELGSYSVTTFDQIVELNDGMILLEGGHASKLRYLVEHDDFDAAMKHGKMLKEAFGDRMFIQLEWDTPLGMVEIADKLGVRLVATNDCRHVGKEERLDYRLFRNMFSPKLIESFRDHEHMITEDEFHELINPEVADRLDEALENIKVIDDMCDDVGLPKAESLKDLSKELTELCEEGWERLRKGTEEEQESRERFEYELSVINGKNFSQYFLKTLNIIKVAYELGVMCGPARGSGGGCEVCFLIGITKIDPLKYGLYFERFLNPGRPGYPDIDIDFTGRPNP